MLGPVRLIGFAILLAAAAGCDNQPPILATDRLPPPDPSRDSTSLRIGTVIYGCGRWFARPDTSYVLVDVRFLNGAGDPGDRPSDAALQAAEAVGFKPLFTFQFPIARGWIATDRIPALDSARVMWQVTSVPDPSRYDLGVTVEYNHPLTAQDSLDFVALGGRVQMMFRTIPALAGDLPNYSAIALRARGARVEADAIFCADGAAGATGGRQ